MNICFVGDSLVLGVGAPAGLGWPGRVCARSLGRVPDLIGFNLGIRGQTSLDIAARWKAEVLPRLPEDTRRGVFFSFGTADAAKAVPLEKTLAAARGILTESAGLFPTLFAGPAGATREDIAPGLSAINTALIGLCAEIGVPALDLYAELAEHPAYVREMQAGDGVHPGAEGYDLITGLVLGWEPFQAFLKG